MNQVFSNRQEAGRRLATKLTAYANHPQAIVLGIPRGGVPVAYEIAKTLNLPLDVCLAKKLGLPNDPEITIGAITEDAQLPDNCSNITIINQNTTQHRVNSEKIKNTSFRTWLRYAAREKAELRWRDRYYQSFRPMLRVSQHTVIVVDDGIITGQTMQAAIAVLKRHKPEKIIIATPVAPLPAIEQLATQVDDFICLIKPKYLGAVDLWYEDFTPTTDREVCDVLSQVTHKILASSYSLPSYTKDNRYARTRKSS
ncbi:phosphoribosyltransferase (plasmid) [Stanieria cyanosphaera PCC 7437]|uniref:Phosphoribosyltransferase n=1 Tax=Stanieria cyanosphaera (strain ATCC 29371 / PCC 7437) TaxID=111780 RepID=K9Y046_STAC7|nr:phosphoribosyltransferase family protein [Stanieria cyanosphaera]AFZ38118.1 phosphoribosyltransferase [Stanieria cyanosphaera PCC 7437]